MVKTEKTKNWFLTKYIAMQLKWISMYCKIIAISIELKSFRYRFLVFLTYFLMRKWSKHSILNVCKELSLSTDQDWYSITSTTVPPYTGLYCIVEKNHAYFLFFQERPGHLPGKQTQRNNFGNLLGFSCVENGLISLNHIKMKLMIIWYYITFKIPCWASSAAPEKKKSPIFSVGLLFCPKGP